MQQFNLEDPYERYILFSAIAIAITYLIYVIEKIRKYIKNKKIKKYNYQKNKRQKENKEAASRWKAKTINQPDPEMFSNEPLTYEKAEELKTKAYNRKYHDFIQAQWDELNK